MSDAFALLLRGSDVLTMTVVAIFPNAEVASVQAPISATVEAVRASLFAAARFDARPAHFDLVTLARTRLAVEFVALVDADPALRRAVEQERSIKLLVLPKPGLAYAHDERARLAARLRALAAAQLATPRDRMRASDDDDAADNASESASDESDESELALPPAASESRRQSVEYSRALLSAKLAELADGDAAAAGDAADAAGGKRGSGKGARARQSSIDGARVRRRVRPLSGVVPAQRRSGARHGSMPLASGESELEPLDDDNGRGGRGAAAPAAAAATQRPGLGAVSSSPGKVKRRSTLRKEATPDDLASERTDAEAAAPARRPSTDLSSSPSKSPKAHSSRRAQLLVDSKRRLLRTRSLTMEDMLREQHASGAPATTRLPAIESESDASSDASSNAESDGESDDGGSDSGGDGEGGAVNKSPKRRVRRRVRREQQGSKKQQRRRRRKAKQLLKLDSDAVPTSDESVRQRSSTLAEGSSVTSTTAMTAASAAAVAAAAAAPPSKAAGADEPDTHLPVMASHGWHAEQPSGSSLVAPSELPANFVNESEPWYAKHFFGREHENYFVTYPKKPKLGVAVLSLRKDDGKFYFVYARTKRRDIKRRVELRVGPLGNKAKAALDALEIGDGAKLRQIRASTPFASNASAGTSSLLSMATGRDETGGSAPTSSSSSSFSTLSSHGINDEQFGAATPIEQLLLTLESRLVVRSYKFGVLYCGPGQKDENEWFSNCAGSPAYDAFCRALGERVPLKGWSKYRAGLDVHGDTTGTHSIYTEWRNLAVMFHVSTELPFQEDDAQRVERKRHLGNDIGIILYNDTGRPIVPSTLKSEFNHVVLAVTPANDAGTKVSVGVATKTGVPAFGPDIAPRAVWALNDELRNTVLMKLVNGESASYNAAGFRFSISRTRDELLRQIATDLAI